MTNFGSYKEFSIDFEAKGLTLLSGKTGSGKSTIPDIVFWVLFGETAKGGSVDDIRSWHGDGATIGTLEVQTTDGIVLITRIRGKTSDNDLYWTTAEGEEPIRGKDLKDTQRLLEAKLGVSPILYEVGAYFHEFSPISNFFLSKAKDRRAIFEQIADLSVPKKLADAAASQRKDFKASFISVTTEQKVNLSKLNQSEIQHSRLKESRDKWEAEKLSTLKTLDAKSSVFDLNKQMKLAALNVQSDLFEFIKGKELEINKSEIESLMALIKPEQTIEEGILKLRFKIDEIKAKRCKECGGPIDNDLCEKYRTQISSLEKAGNLNQRNIDRLEVLKKNMLSLSNRANPYTGQIDDLLSKVNTYAEIIAAKSADVNPHGTNLDFLADEIKITQQTLMTLNSELTSISHRLALLDKLYDLSFDMRGLILQNAVRQVQDRANHYLETYFDGELHIKLTLDGADSLEVELTKNGYVCGYRQLSKGQRGLLKLCFSVAIMSAASDQAGVHFDTLFFDEALDGYDTNFKVKAFDLFQELSKSHSSVFVIDHDPEFQGLFENQIHVIMEEDVSRVDDSTFIGSSTYESSNDKERTGAA